MRTLVIHLFHGDPASLGSGSHVAERIRQVKDQRGIDLEVYLFGPAEEKLLDPEAAELNANVDGLIAAGGKVKACLNTAAGLGATQAFAERGIQLEFARDAFARYAAEGATVISF